jgi:hypothetical protein
MINLVKLKINQKKEFISFYWSFYIYVASKKEKEDCEVGGDKIT